MSDSRQRSVCSFWQSCRHELPIVIMILPYSHSPSVKKPSQAKGTFHLEVVERRLNSSNLTTEEKITVIDKILDNLKSHELDGIIK